MGRTGSIVGLDVGRNSVKAAWADYRGGKPVIVATELLRLPGDGSDVGELVRAWIRQHQIHKSRVVLGIPGQRILFQPLVRGAQDPRTDEQVVDVEVLKFNEMASEEMIHGFARAATPDGTDVLLLGMARPPVLQEMLKLARDSGLDVVDAVPGPVACFAALDQLGQVADKPVMCLSVGQSATDVIVGSKAGLIFARSVSAGGQLFTDSLAKQQKVSVRQAEQLKTERNLLEVGLPAGQSLATAAEMWLSEVRSCLSVYKGTFGAPELQPASIVLAGGGSGLKGLAALVESKLGLPTLRLGDKPLAGLSAERPDLFLTAAGLALCGLKDSGRHMSILPVEVREQLFLRRQKPFWMAAALVGLLILGINLVGGTREIKRREAALQNLREVLQKRQDIAAGIEAAKAMNADLSSMAAGLHSLVQTAPLVRELLYHLSSSLAKGDWVTLVCDADSYFNPPQLPGGTVANVPRDLRRPAAGPAYTTTSRVDRVMIEGYTPTRNLSTAKELIARVAVPFYVESADLLNDELVRGFPYGPSTNPPNLTPFVLDVRIRQP